MPVVKAVVTKWVDDEPQPGIVEVVLEDAAGMKLVIHEKSAVVDDGTLDISPDSQYPIEIGMQCKIVKEMPEADSVVITLDWNIETVDGQSEFVVKSDQITR